MGLVLAIILIAGSFLLGGAVTMVAAAVIHDLFDLLAPIGFFDGVKLYVVLFLLSLALGTRMSSE